MVNYYTPLSVISNVIREVKGGSLKWDSFLPSRITSDKCLITSSRSLSFATIVQRIAQPQAFVQPNKRISSLFSHLNCFVLTTQNSKILTLKPLIGSARGSISPLFLSQESAMHYLTTLQTQNPTFVSTFGLGISSLTLEKYFSTPSAFLPILDDSFGESDAIVRSKNYANKSYKGDLIFPSYILNVPNSNGDLKDSHVFFNRGQVKLFLASQSRINNYSVCVCEIEDLFRYLKGLDNKTLQSFTFHPFAKVSGPSTPASFRFLGMHFGVKDLKTLPLWRYRQSQNLYRVKLFFELSRELVGQFHLDSLEHAQKYLYSKNFRDKHIATHGPLKTGTFTDSVFNKVLWFQRRGVRFHLGSNDPNKKLVFPHVVWFGDPYSDVNSLSFVPD